MEQLIETLEAAIDLAQEAGLDDLAVRLTDELNMLILDDEEYDGQPDEAQEWHDFDPEC